MLTFVFPLAPRSKHLMSGANITGQRTPSHLYSEHLTSNSLMDGATISHDNISQVQKQANAFDTAHKHASEKVLGKKLKNKEDH